MKSEMKIVGSEIVGRKFDFFHSFFFKLEKVRRVSFSYERGSTDEKLFVRLSNYARTQYFETSTGNFSFPTITQYSHRLAVDFSLPRTNYAR